jgi:heme/copper-type cytochrome/quinol oxidase subunit 2
MIFAFPVMLFLLVIWVLTLLAWIEGMRATAGAGEAKADIQRRVLLPMVLLTVPFAILVIFFVLRFGHVVSLVWPGRMAIIGLFSALAALITSLRAPRGFRGLAISASMAWLVCFGLALMAMFALRGLR